jgi:hypothetical protein
MFEVTIVYKVGKHLRVWMHNYILLEQAFARASEESFSIGVSNIVSVQIRAVNVG